MLSSKLLPKLICPAFSPSFLFSTQNQAKEAEPAKILTINTSINGLPNNKYRELTSGLESCKTMSTLVYYFRKYPKIITLYHLRLAFRRIASLHMELIQDFWDVVFPYAKALVKTANRESVDTMAACLLSLSELLIQDEEIWQVAQEKLVKEKMLRYVMLGNVPSLLYAFANNKKGTKETMDAIENLILTHIKYYQGALNEKMFDHLKIAYDLMEKVPPPVIQELLSVKYRDPVPLPDL